MQPTPFTLRAATSGDRSQLDLCGPPARPTPRPPTPRLAALVAAAGMTMLMLTSAAGAATLPDLAATRLAGVPASLTTGVQPDSS